MEIMRPYLLIFHLLTIVFIAVHHAGKIGKADVEYENDIALQRHFGGRLFPDKWGIRKKTEFLPPPGMAKQTNKAVI
ncbi:hypothetical protein OESDEN_05444 [Oesophagostomum dentatum]|uniref:Uncharacterized protein n=1 Tax=Oesophagostomum dentatum TaxID=61180 RepID=A0A0B1TGW7_OESDE|nr:hypothetical protein OESDEN_05444 [Oesophagostomum dentatum]